MVHLLKNILCSHILSDILMMIFETICNSEKHLWYKIEWKQVTEIVLEFLEFAAISILMNNDKKNMGRNAFGGSVGRFEVSFSLKNVVTILIQWIKIKLPKNMLNKFQNLVFPV